MIIDKIGDILHTEADVICHQVNCKGVIMMVFIPDRHIKT